MAKASVKVQQLPGGQIIVSIPGALATALDIKKGDEIVFKIENGRLYLERQ